MCREAYANLRYLDFYKHLRNEHEIKSTLWGELLSSGNDFA